MITEESVKKIEEAFKRVTTLVPEVIHDMGETARMLVSAEATVKKHEQTIAMMNVQSQDQEARLKDMAANHAEAMRKKDDQICALLAENAQQASLLNNIGQSIAQSREVQNSLEILAAQRNGKLIPHEGKRPLVPGEAN